MSGRKRKADNSFEQSPTKSRKLDEEDSPTKAPTPSLNSAGSHQLDPQTQTSKTYSSLPCELRQMILTHVLNWDVTAATSRPQVFERLLSPQAREQGIRFQILRERLENYLRMGGVFPRVSLQFAEDYRCILNQVEEELMEAEPEVFVD
jgi:hypothetical protein